MSGPVFYVAPDAEEEPTLWRHGSDDREPIALARKCELHETAWHLMEVGMWLVNEGAPA